jgi:transcriptional regulator with GAF, ATPase, and Fis domain
MNGATERAASAGEATRSIVGEGPAMKALRRRIELVAAASSPVLIRGETGTGKELVARALHQASPRKDLPFVSVNASAIPEALLESEMFGHVRGAFTGAACSRRGLFAEANGGTLLLDEVGDMPLVLQPKLLRVLQAGEYRPVGGERMQKIDVRVIAATHRDLAERVQAGLFREDLSIASTSFRSTCHRCANGGRTSRRWPSTCLRA